MRFAYADPPYIGQAEKHYGNHEDYAGEVDHRALIERMESEYDCWALSLTMRIYSWEPVIIHESRRLLVPRQARGLGDWA